MHQHDCPLQPLCRQTSVLCVCFPRHPARHRILLLSRVLHTQTENGIAKVINSSDNVDTRDKYCPTSYQKTTAASQYSQLHLIRHPLNLSLRLIGPNTISTTTLIRTTNRLIQHLFVQNWPVSCQALICQQSISWEILCKCEYKYMWCLVANFILQSWPQMQSLGAKGTQDRKSYGKMVNWDKFHHTENLDSLYSDWDESSVVDCN